MIKKSDIEMILRYKISSDLFDKSLNSAKNKQTYLFKNSKDSAILQDWYLQQLVREYIISFSFQEFTLDLCRAFNNNMEKEHQTKSQGTPYSNHIVSHSIQQIN